jgi:hypothetical protein
VADLTQTQIKQLLNYCESVEREGWYYGNQYQFIARHNAIVKWLLERMK